MNDNQKPKKSQPRMKKSETLEVRIPHETKQALQGLSAAIKKAQETGSADGNDINDLIALRDAQERLLGPDLARVPGGQEYLDRMAVSSRDRLVNDQLEAGQMMGKNLTSTPWEDVRAATQELAGKTIHGTPIGATTQRRALGATRKGVASSIRDKARGKSPDAVLSDLESQNVQEAIIPLQAGRNVNPQEVSDRFRERISDRRKMATTNQQQSKIKQQELLEGSKSAGTALNFQESGALSGRLGAVKTALGALGGKALAGRRKEVTALSADQIAALLQRTASDATNPARAFEYAMMLKMLQQARMRTQGRVAGAVGSTLSRRDQ